MNAQTKQLTDLISDQVDKLGQAAQRDQDNRAVIATQRTQISDLQAQLAAAQNNAPDDFTNQIETLQANNEVIDSLSPKV